MLDGQQPQAKTYMAADEAHGKAVTFQANSKEEARKMLVDEGLTDYKIVWESTPREIHD